MVLAENNELEFVKGDKMETMYCVNRLNNQIYKVDIQEKIDRFYIKIVFRKKIIVYPMRGYYLWFFDKYEEARDAIIYDYRDEISKKMGELKKLQSMIDEFESKIKTVNFIDVANLDYFKFHKQVVFDTDGKMCKDEK